MLSGFKGNRQTGNSAKKRKTTDDTFVVNTWLSNTQVHQCHDIKLRFPNYAWIGWKYINKKGKRSIIVNRKIRVQYGLFLQCNFETNFFAEIKYRKIQKTQRLFKP